MEENGLIVVSYILIIYCRSLWFCGQPTDQHPRFEYIRSMVRLKIRTCPQWIGGSAIPTPELGTQHSNKKKPDDKNELSSVQVHYVFQPCQYPIMYLGGERLKPFFNR